MIRDQIKAEYDRCLDLYHHPEKAPALFNVEGREAVRNYYAYRAEALGWVLDRMPNE